MRRLIAITLIMILAGFLSIDNLFAVEAKKTLPSQPVKAAKDVQPQIPAPQSLVPAAVPPIESTYNYNPVGKPDPFRPFVEQEIAAKKKEEKKVVSSIFPLQRTEVDKFRLVGIAVEQNRRIAMVEDVTKKYYPLSVGTHIGINKGKVIEILPDRVIVEEYETKKPRRIILKLHKN